MSARMTSSGVSAGAMSAVGDEAEAVSPLSLSFSVSRNCWKLGKRLRYLISMRSGGAASTSRPCGDPEMRPLGQLHQIGLAQIALCPVDTVGKVVCLPDGRRCERSSANNANSSASLSTTSEIRTSPSAAIRRTGSIKVWKSGIDNGVLPSG